jgi:hypothetical protein
MVGVLMVGFVANLLIRPVADRHLEPAEEGARFVRDEPAWVGSRSAATAERS